VRRLTVCVVSISALVGAFYLGLWTADRRVSDRIEMLKSELRAPTYIADPSVWRMIRAPLTATDAYLDRHSQWREGFAAPAMWQPERRAELERGFQSLGTFFEQVDSLLDDVTCRSVLDHGEIVSELDPMPGLSRHRTNVLCARALTEFEEPDGSRLAARRLGQALDLIRLGDNGREIAYMTSTAEEDIVLSALRQLLADDRADGAAFQRELDDRLERVSREDRVEAVLKSSVELYLESERWRSEASWARPWTRYEAWRERRRVSEGLAMSIELARTDNLKSRALFMKGDAMDRPACVNGWMIIADSFHLHELHLDLARRALALAADRETRGAPTVDRYTGGFFQERPTERGIALCAASAMAAQDIGNSDSRARLLTWTIPR